MIDSRALFTDEDDVGIGEGDGMGFVVDVGDCVVAGGKVDDRGVVPANQLEASVTAVGAEGSGVVMDEPEWVGDVGDVATA